MNNAGKEVDAIIKRSNDWRGETLSRLRATVLSASPDIAEEVKWKKPSKPEGVYRCGPLRALSALVRCSRTPCG